MSSYEERKRAEVKATIIMVAVGIAVLIGIIGLFKSAEIVDTTERVVVTEFGKVDRVLGEGFHLINPFTENTTKYVVSTQKVEVAATAASQDLQDVTATVVVQYNIDPVNVESLYRDYRTWNNARSSVVDPAIQDAIKAGTAAFNAEALITQRPAVKEAIENALRERLSEAFLTVSNVDIIDFKFSQSFNEAIEAKVTAEQEAQKAENDLERVKFEADQRVAQAVAEAEAIKIQAEAITQQGGDNYVQLQAIEKWDGQLPQQFVPGSAVPFLNI